MTKALLWSNRASGISDFSSSCAPFFLLYFAAPDGSVCVLLPIGGLSPSERGEAACLVFPVGKPVEKWGKIGAQISLFVSKYIEKSELQSLILIENPNYECKYKDFFFLQSILLFKISTTA